MTPTQRRILTWSVFVVIALGGFWLVAATIGPNHGYPDGLVLYLGTMFAPVEDRDTPGEGFTHKVGDIVTVGSPKLGHLSNVVVHCADAEPWTFGAGALMRNLAKRGVL